MRTLLLTFVCFLSFSQTCFAQTAVLDCYESALTELNSHYERSDFSLLSTALNSAKQIRAFQVPMYELNFYEAVILLEHGKYIQGSALLDDFSVMLLIYSGHLECSTKKIAVLVDIERAEKIARSMCAEYYLAYYERPTFHSLKRIVRFPYLVEIAKKKYAEPQKAY